MGKKYFLLFFLTVQFSTSCLGFVSVDSLILGDVGSEIDLDYPELIEMKNDRYSQIQKSAVELTSSCSWRSKPRFISQEIKDKDILDYISSIQYASLKALSINIALLSKRLSLSKDEFKNLSRNVVNNFCSENLTIISKKELFNNLIFIYKNTILNSSDKQLGPFDKFLSRLLKPSEFYQNQLRSAVNAFRSFCSWGGKPGDLGLLNPFLSSPHITSIVLDNIYLGKTDYPYVSCENLICRRDKASAKKRGRFVSISKDYYCSYFSKLSKRPDPESPTLQGWAKKTTDDDFTFQISQLTSSMTNMPNILAISNKKNNKEIYSSHLDFYFLSWANEKLDYFSKKIVYEEKIKIRKLIGKADGRGRAINFEVDYGELDNARNSVGKINAKFGFSINFKLVTYIFNEINYANRWSLKKEKHLKKVIKEHLVFSSDKVYLNFFHYLEKEYFFNQISRAIYDDIASLNHASLSKFNGEYVFNFYFGLFALNHIRNITKIKI